MSDPAINAIARVLCCGKNCDCSAETIECRAEDEHGTEACKIKTLLPSLGFHVVEPDPLPPAPRQGDWQQTFSGGQFWPLDPRPGDVHVLDIASGLSKTCRYGGQCLRFYSVAEHCVLLARHAAVLGLPLRDRRTLLLHDASEAYLGDVPRPLKRWLPQYCEIEDAVMAVIAERYDFDWPLPAYLKQFDEAIGLDEAQIMAPPPAPWPGPFAATLGLGVTIDGWLPDIAQAEFLREFSAVGAR